jgi:hypothetical protein
LLTIDSSRYDARVISSAINTNGKVCALIKNVDRDDLLSGVVVYSKDLSPQFKGITDLDLIYVCDNRSLVYPFSDFLFLSRSGEIVVLGDAGLQAVDNLPGVTDLLIGIHDFGEGMVAYGEGGQAFVRRLGSRWRKSQLSPSQSITSDTSISLRCACATHESSTLYFGGYATPPVLRKDALENFFAGEASLEDAMATVRSAPKSFACLFVLSGDDLIHIEIPFSGQVSDLCESCLDDEIFIGTNIGNVFKLTPRAEISEALLLGDGVSSINRNDKDLLVSTDREFCIFNTESEIVYVEYDSSDIVGNLNLYSSPSLSYIYVNGHYIRSGKGGIAQFDIPDDIVVALS